MFNCDTVSSNKGDINCEQLELLKKLQQENEKLEEDSKAPPPSSLKKFHSRQGSTSSLLSINSAASSGSSLYHPCSHEVSPCFPLTSTFHEQSSSNSGKILKSKSNTSSSTAELDSWDSWLSLISDWEHFLKNQSSLQRPSKLHQRAAELFRQTWCIPDAIRGLVWQLVSGAREENMACVILNPSAAVAGLTCLKSSALLSAEHLFDLLPEKKVDDCDLHKEFNTPKSVRTAGPDRRNSVVGSEDRLVEVTKESTRRQSDYEMLQQNNKTLSVSRNVDIQEQDFSAEQSGTFSGTPTSSLNPVRYADLLAVPSPHEKTISRDISRTYPNHAKFKVMWGKGQESLFNVARAYSVYDKEVGYCQGSSFIIGLLLMHMPEEDAFGVLIRIMYAYNLRDLFKPSMEALGLKMFQLERLVQDNLPEIYSVFSAQGIRASMFASPWFLTLFATTLPLPLVRQAFDAFLCQGSHVIFHLGLALLKVNQSCLLGLIMEDLVQFLQKDLGARAEADPGQFFTTAFQFKINPKKMKKLEKEYADVSSQEKAEQTEVCRLRNENRRLQGVVDKLEKETGSLADQLVSRQVQCAHLAEETSVLRHAVTSARKLLVDHNIVLHSPSEVSVDSKNDMASYIPAPSGGAFVALDNTLVTAEVESLREELIGCKLREAEANLSIRELQHEIHEIQKLWNKQTKSQKTDGFSNLFVGSNAQTSSALELEQALLGRQVREAGLSSELADARLNLSALEHKVNSLEKRNSQLEKQLACSNFEIGSLIRDNKMLSRILMENEKDEDFSLDEHLDAAKTSTSPADTQKSESDAGEAVDHTKIESIHLPVIPSANGPLEVEAGELSEE